MPETIAILDFGSQYTQLIARRVRELSVFCRIHPFHVPAAELRSPELRGIILSGGPASVYRDDAPRLDAALLDLGVPVLGICYGLQSLALATGGQVAAGRGGEYGRTVFRTRRGSTRATDALFDGVADESVVWMSHGDQLVGPPPGFDVIGSSDPCPYAAVARKDGRVFGIQFHPEVTHTEQGRRILHNFLYRVCRVSGDWSMGDFIDLATSRLREQIGDGRVVLGLSGGVDSSVAAVLLHEAVGDQLDAIFVDNGLLRQDEREEVERTFREQHPIRLHVVDAREAFLSDLRGVTDPEEKRRRIGHRFIEVFREEARRCEGARFLAQGTLYPDVIESTSAFGGPSATIKTHHNVGGLPDDLGFELVEPFRELFKDEVRQIGRLLGLPDRVLLRHPFPGPGLAVRVLGEVTEERLDILRRADHVFREVLADSGWEAKTQQAFVVLLPVRTVGVQGDQRTYGYACVLRAVTTEDFMTADFAELPAELLARAASRITNEVREINRVTYDITSKPPGTIEWE